MYLCTSSMHTPAQTPVYSVYMYIHLYIYIHTCIYIYVYIDTTFYKILYIINVRESIE